MTWVLVIFCVCAIAWIIYSGEREYRHVTWDFAAHAEVARHEAVAGGTRCLVCHLPTWHHVHGGRACICDGCHGQR